MISITIDLDRLGCRSIKVKIIRLAAEHQTAVTAVEQVDQDAFESKPVHLTRVAGERGQFQRPRKKNTLCDILCVFDY